MVVNNNKYYKLLHKISQYSGFGVMLDKYSNRMLKNGYKNAP